MRSRNPTLLLWSIGTGLKKGVEDVYSDESQFHHTALVNWGRGDQGVPSVRRWIQGRNPTILPWSIGARLTLYAGYLEAKSWKSQSHRTALVNGDMNGGTVRGQELRTEESQSHRIAWSIGTAHRADDCR